MSKMRFTIPYQLEPNEQIIGEYETTTNPKPHGIAEGDKGVLVITSKRILFYKSKSLLKKLVKKDAVMFELTSSIYLSQVQQVSKGGTSLSFRKFVSINGNRYFLATANNKQVSKVIKSAIAGSASGKTVSITQQSNQSMQKSKYCSKCGKENNSDAKFCNGCGSTI